MERLRNLRIALVAGGVLAMAVMASAQITTGTVYRDGQGRAGRRHPRRHGHADQRDPRHQAARVVTDRGGDFVFLNVPADTYTVQVTMPAFKTLQADRRRRQPRRPPVGSARLYYRGRRRHRTVVVKAEAPLIQAQSGERSFTIPTERGREPADRQPQLHRAGARWRPASPAPVGNPTRIGGGGDTNIMMDGVGGHGHRQQPRRCSR